MANEVKRYIMEANHLKIAPIQSFNELWTCFVQASPLDPIISWVLWWYLWLWCWLSFKLYRTVALYDNNKPLGVMIYRWPKIYFIGIIQEHRRKGYCSMLVQYSKCTQFCLMTKHLMPLAIKLGFARKRGNYYELTNS